MIKSVSFTNFTSVPSGKWKFSPRLNIIVGENGLGKSHVLKSIYSILKAQSSNGSQIHGVPSERLGKIQLERKIAYELSGNMRPDVLGRLVKRKQGRGRAEIAVHYKNTDLNVRFSFASNSMNQVDVIWKPAPYLSQSPVFIPTRELLTLCPWFVSLYDSYNVPFEKTWRDTVQLLGSPSLRSPPKGSIRDMLLPIEDAMGGKVRVDQNGRFYLIGSGGRMEVTLVAEGLRKFAMLARLISTGVLLEQGYLFWDEPEANLNPKLVKVLAQVIVNLSDQGIQVFIATHSVFLLREISIITANKKMPKSRYFALVASGDEEVSNLQQSDTIEGLDTLVLLDEELQQSDRFMDVQQDA